MSVEDSVAGGHLCDNLATLALGLVLCQIFEVSQQETRKILFGLSFVLGNIVFQCQMESRDYLPCIFHRRLETFRA